MSRVRDKVVFITGAGRGMGRSHAVKLAKEGADVVAVDVCRQLTDEVHYAYATARTSPRLAAWWRTRVDDA